MGEMKTEDNGGEEWRGREEHEHLGGHRCKYLPGRIK